MQLCYLETDPFSFHFKFFSFFFVTWKQSHTELVTHSMDTRPLCGLSPIVHESCGFSVWLVNTALHQQLEGFNDSFPRVLSLLSSLISRTLSRNSRCLGFHGPLARSPQLRDYRTFCLGFSSLHCSWRFNHSKKVSSLKEYPCLFSVSRRSRSFVWYPASYKALFHISCPFNVCFRQEGKFCPCYFILTSDGNTQMMMMMMMMIMSSSRSSSILTAVS